MTISKIMEIFDGGGLSFATSLCCRFLVLCETRDWAMCAAESKSLCAVLELFLVASDKCAANLVHVRVTICLL